MRPALLALVAALPLSLGRPALAVPDHTAGPLHVEFRVESPEHKGPIAAGSMEMAPFEGSRFELSGAGSQKLSVKLLARPQADGTVEVEMELDEVDANGQVVKWQPAMMGKRGKRGTPLSATIQAGDTTRTMVVTVR